MLPMKICIFRSYPPHHRISGPEHDFLIGVRDCYIFLYFTIFYLRVACPGHMHSFCSIIYYYTFIWSLTVIFPTRFLILIYYTPRQRYINGYGIFFNTHLIYTSSCCIFYQLCTYLHVEKHIKTLRTGFLFGIGVLINILTNTSSI